MLSTKSKTTNPALNLAPFGRWTALKRRRLALRLGRIEMSRRIFAVIASLLLATLAGQASANNFTIEPVLAEADFRVLGYASGSFIKKGKLGCFKVKSAKLALNKKSEDSAEIIGFRFGLAFPVEGTYDYLAQTDLFPVNRTLSKGKPLHFNGIELCLNLPVETNEGNQFLSMEIHLKHNNKYGYATTYAHEKQKYENLVAKASK